jgi:hypothetical protein
MKFNLNEDGSKYAVYCLNQIWFRSSQMNPGTMIERTSGQTLETFALAFANIKRYMIVTHFGINNQTFTNGGAAGSSGTGGYGAGKNQNIFSRCLERIRLSFLKRQKI